MKKIRIDKFNIFLPDWWQDISNSNPDGPPTFIDGRLEEPGVLQISTAIYVSSEKPNPNFEDLIQLSEMLGQRNAFGDVVNRTFGKCKLGKYGMVEFSGEISLTYQCATFQMARTSCLGLSYAPRIQRHRK